MNITIGELGQVLGEEILKTVLPSLEPSGLSEAGHQHLLDEIADLRKHTWNLEDQNQLLANIRDENDAELMALAERCQELEYTLKNVRRNHRAAGVVIKSLRAKLDAPRRRCDICLS